MEKLKKARSMVKDRMKTEKDMSNEAKLNAGFKFKGGNVVEKKK